MIDSEDPDDYITKKRPKLTFVVYIFDPRHANDNIIIPGILVLLVYIRC